MIADALFRQREESDKLKNQLILIVLLNLHKNAIYENYDTEEAEHTDTQEVLQRLKKKGI